MELMSLFLAIGRGSVRPSSRNLTKRLSGARGTPASGGDRKSLGPGARNMAKACFQHDALGLVDITHAAVERAVSPEQSRLGPKIRC